MGDERASVDVPNFSEVGLLRETTYREAREEIGAPGSYTFAINGSAVEDNHKLQNGDVVSFRPRTGDKGTI